MTAEGVPGVLPDINDRGKEIAFGEYEQIREKLTKLCFDAVVELVEWERYQQQLLMNNMVPPEQEIGFFIEEDFFVAPIVDGEFQRTLGIRLEATEDDSASCDAMLLWMPVPDDADIEHPDFDPHSLPVPETFYVAVLKGGKVQNTSISITGVIEYETEIETGKQELKDDFHPETMLRLARKRLHSGLPFLTQLLEDVVNMTAVPQDWGVAADFMPEPNDEESFD